MAFGLDRLMTILCGGDSIRGSDCISKTQKGAC
ncbi:MAG: hypothetical protein R2874_17185 [Desulfobacterales bacterium]